jgi:hypothetical protein
MKTNYMPKSISFADGFLGAEFLGGDQLKKIPMFYDEQKAKNIINDILKLNEIIKVEVGLDGDWEINHDTLFENNEFKNVDFWSKSNWATPIMIIYFKNKPSECYEIWKEEE